ncbi:TPA: LysE family transporter [Serratia liquefaciens]|nr:LysE family transporter [Serratia liquefaciens]
MNSVLILSCATLLFVPGPTNILLLNSGASRGFRGAHLLMAAEWGGYLISITSWSALTFLLLSAGEKGIGIFKLFCAGYLMFLSVQIWRSEVNPSDKLFNPKSILITTILNPKALIFSSVIFPASVLSEPEVYLFAFLNFSSVVLAASAFWISLGVMVKRRKNTKKFDIAIRSVSSMALTTFSLFMVYSAFSHHTVT